MAVHLGRGVEHHKTLCHMVREWDSQGGLEMMILKLGKQGVLEDK